MIFDSINQHMKNFRERERERERERVESRIESLDNFVTRNLKNITEHLNENENLIEI